MSSHSNSRQLVRVQDDFYGMSLDQGDLVLRRPMNWKPQPDLDLYAVADHQRYAYARDNGYQFARDTLHFTQNGIVSNHARGEFNGGIVIVTPLNEMKDAGALGNHKDDTWFHVDQNGALKCPQAILLVPEGLSVPQELEEVVRRYPAPDAKSNPQGFVQARDEAFRSLMQEMNQDMNPIGTIAVHMGSTSEKMENALNQFQTNLASAKKHGPEAWAKERLALAASDSRFEEPWMSMPKNQDTAVKVSEAYQEQMRRDLHSVLEEVNQSQEPGLHAAAKERFADRIKVCEAVLLSESANLKQTALFWGGKMASGATAIEFPPPMPDQTQKSYWGWVDQKMQSIQEIPKDKATSMQHLGMNACCDRVAAGSVIAYESMDGMVRAREAKDIMPSAFQHHQHAILPPPLPQLNISSGLAARRDALRDTAPEMRPPALSM